MIGNEFDRLLFSESKEAFDNNEILNQSNHQHDSLKHTVS